MKTEYIIMLQKENFIKILKATRANERDHVSLVDPTREDIIRYVNHGLVNPRQCPELKEGL